MDTVLAAITIRNMETPADRLRIARELAGYKTQQAFFGTHGISQPTYSLHESGKRPLPKEAADRYAPLLGVSAEWLLYGRGAGPKQIEVAIAAVSTDQAAEPPPEPNVDLSRAAPPPPPSMDRDVPVLGLAVGGDDGDFELNGEVIDFVRRPPGIRGSTAVFAVYMDGESMSPWKEPGDTVYIHRKRPININDYVLIELQSKADDVAKAMVKRLVRRTATELVVRQFTPPKDFRLPKDKVKNIFKVLSDRDLYGI